MNPWSDTRGCGITSDRYTVKSVFLDMMDQFAECVGRSVLMLLLVKQLLVIFDVLLGH